MIHIKVTVGNVEGGGAVLCGPSCGKHWFIWLLRLHQEVGIPFCRTGVIPKLAARKLSSEEEHCSLGSAVV